MSHLLTDRVTVLATPTTLWSMIDDPAALARVLPGAESVEALAPGRYRCVMSTRLQFLTVRADAEATVTDTEPPRRRRIEIVGRPRGLAGSFRVTIDIDLAPVDMPAGPSSGAEVGYVVDLDVSGRLASFGIPLLRETMRRQVAQLVANIDNVVLARRTDQGAAG